METAGLKCPPENLPAKKIETARVKPTAKAKIGLSDGKLRMTETSIKVPINSAKYLFIYIYIFYIKKLYKKYYY